MRRLSLLPLFVTLVGSLLSSAALGALTVSIDSLVLPAGGNPGSFQVVLANDGPDQGLSDFQLTLTVDSSQGVFTGVDFGTIYPYVFIVSPFGNIGTGFLTFDDFTNPLLDFELTDGVLFPGDESTPAIGSVTILANTVVGLGHVYFELAAGYSGVPTITLSAPIFLDGPDTLDIEGAAAAPNVVPEPCSMLMFLTGGIGLFATGAVRRRKR